jgi:hypothetical protein
VKARHIALGLAATASAAAAIWLPSEPKAVVLPVARAPATAQAARRPASAEAGTRLASLAPRIAPDEQQPSAFGVPDWTQLPPLPKPAAPAPAVEAAPQVPPAPFRIIGRYDEDGRTGLFLEHQQKSLIARVGDQLTPEWKVDAIENTRLVLEYLPLAQKQTLEWSTP